MPMGNVTLGCDWSNTPKQMGNCAMSKRSAKKSKRRSKALPALGFAGVSFSLASGACASVSEATASAPPASPSQTREIVLGEEEISDVSLATFYVYDKENGGSPALAQKLRLARCGGCGCGHGCGGGGCAHAGCGGGGCAHVGCAGTGCAHVGCAGTGFRCGGGIHVGCAGGCHVACRGGRCGGLFIGACVGCVGCAGCADTCWAWVPVWGWVYTCAAESTPAGETSPVVVSTPSAPMADVTAKADGTIAGTGAD